MCKTDEIKCLVVGERSRVKRLGCMASFLWRSEKERQLGMEGKIRSSLGLEVDYEVSA